MHNIISMQISEKDGVWSHETTLSCDVDYQKPKDYER